MNEKPEYLAGNRSFSGATAGCRTAGKALLAWAVDVDSSTNYSEQQNAAPIPRLQFAQSRKAPPEQNSIWAGDKGPGRMLTEQGVVADLARLHTAYRAM